jgi:hypothetical protein
MFIGLDVVRGDWIGIQTRFVGNPPDNPFSVPFSVPQATNRCEYKIEIS